MSRNDRKTKTGSNMYIVKCFLKVFNIYDITEMSFRNVPCNIFQQAKVRGLVPLQGAC